MRHKQLGKWEATSWRQYAERAAAVGMGLRALGIEPGDRVAVLAGNCPEWLFSDLGIQGVGAATVGLYPTSSPNEVECLLAHSGPKVLIAENEEQFDKAWAVHDRLPQLSKVVVVDTRGMRQPHDSLVMSFAELEDLGGKDGATDAFARLVAAIDPTSPAIVSYTPGTTGPLRAALLSHQNLMGAGRAFCDAFGSRPDDEVLSYLPLGHVTERVVSEIDALLAGSVVNFGEGGESLGDDLREVQPTVFFGVPMVWERMMAGVQLRMGDASALKRAAYRFAQSQGEAVAPKRMAGQMGMLDRLRSGVAWLLVFRPLRDKLGLSRVRVAISGAAPLVSPVVEFFWAMGVCVREGYGQTEGTALATFTSGAVRTGTVGTPLAGVELRLGPDGEILVRSPGVFVGYLNDEPATRQAVDPEGWLHSGDFGHIGNDGYLTVTSRKNDMLIGIIEEMYA
jgi:long-chain acyl-CoA synthetase